MINLYGQHDENLKLLAKNTQTTINARGNQVQVEGKQINVDHVEKLLAIMLDEAQSESLNLNMTHIITQGNQPTNSDDSVLPQEVNIQTRKGVITGRSLNQKLYLQNIVSNDINFGVGPAGTGKTYLAVACAVEAILNKDVQRIILVRPAVGS